jgi:hypothetical protein
VQDRFPAGKNPPQEIIVSDISLHHLNPGQEMGEIFFLAGGKIIQDSHPVPILHQGFHQVGSDKAGAAGNQYFHYRKRGIGRSGYQEAAIRSSGDQVAARKPVPDNPDSLILFSLIS